MRCTVDLNDVFVFRLNLVYELLTFGLDQDFDARLVDVVTAAKTVVSTYNSFEVIENLVPGQKVANGRCNDGCAAHAAADQHFKAQLAV